MKKVYFLALMLLFAGSMSAQIYSEDFESYNVGDYMGVVNTTYWTTWSGSTGGAEDVQVTNANASSGTKSIYFSSTSSQGGPQDVVLKFGQQYTSGIFTFEADFYVESGKEAYWNFQATQTIGQTWALNCNMDDNGNIDFDGLATSTYPTATWFTLKIEANLTLGLWEFWVDGISGGVWNNPINSVASLDLYPLQGNGFYVDDVSFDHQTYTLPQLNAGLAGLDMVGAVAGMTVYPRLNVMNAGVNQVTSFDVTIDYNGNQIQENITGLTMASLDNFEVEFSNPLTLVAGQNNAVAIVSNVNGQGQDGDPSDDTLILAVNPVVPATGKVVVGEEATGTWCQWCPRGAVYMDIWTEKYGSYFAGVAVHNNDPMADATYDGGIGSLISGYPSALVDRLGDVDPSNMRSDIETRLQTAPMATILNGAQYDSQTRVLDVSLTTTWAQNASGAYQIACALTEDSVTGTSSGYAQANAYAGGGNGPMGGYENLPSTVPASQMVYEHVARAISPSFTGQPNSFPGSVTSGQSFVHNFSFTLPQDWDVDKMHIVGMLIDPNGQVDNAGYTTVDEAIQNGFVVGIENDNVFFPDGPDQSLKLYPNPTTGPAFATLKMNGIAQVSLSIHDVTGKTVLSRNYGELDGSHTFPLNLSTLSTGIYTVRVAAGEEVFTERLVVE